MVRRRGTRLSPKFSDFDTGPRDAKRVRSETLDPVRLHSATSDTRPVDVVDVARRSERPVACSSDEQTAAEAIRSGKLTQIGQASTKQLVTLEDPISATQGANMRSTHVGTPPSQRRRERSSEPTRKIPTRTKVMLCGGLLTILTICATATAWADPVMVVTSIKQIRTGWNSDAFAVVPTDKVANPGKCTTPDGYLSDATQPGFKVYYAAALLAFAQNARVVVTIDGCLGTRPRLIGINIER